MRPWVGVLLIGFSFAGTCGAAALGWRAHQHNAYHRSKAAENEMFWRMLLAFPPGTALETFERRLGLSSADRVERGERIEIRLRPVLPVPMHETRDYRGFNFLFKDGVLVDAEPVGPDAPGRDIDVSPVLNGSRADKEATGR